MTACVPTLVLALVMIPMATTYADGDEIAELHKQLDSHLSASEWKKAASVARLIKLKGDDEESEKMEQLLFHIGGRQDLDKLRTQKLKPRKALKRIDKLLERHAKDAKLVAAIRSYGKGIKELVYLTIDDFEGELRGDTLAPVTNPAKVREGKRAARWRAARGSRAAFINCKEKDWTGYTHLVFWLYGEKPGRLELQPMTDVHDNFNFSLNVKVGSWYQVRIPLHDPKVRWRQDGEPDWTRISALRLRRGRGSRVDFRIDDVRLEKPKKK